MMSSSVFKLHDSTPITKVIAASVVKYLCVIKSVNAWREKDILFFSGESKVKHNLSVRSSFTCRHGSGMLIVTSENQVNRISEFSSYLPTCYVVHLQGRWWWPSCTVVTHIKVFLKEKRVLNGEPSSICMADLLWALVSSSAGIVMLHIQAINSLLFIFCSSYGLPPRRKTFSNPENL
jgi:hypothetical protein